MNRRSIFKLALCAVAASAMEVFGWEGVKPFDAPTYEGEFRWINGYKPYREASTGRWTAVLMEAYNPKKP